MWSSSTRWTCVTQSRCYCCAGWTLLITPCCSITHWTMKCQVLPPPTPLLFNFPVWMHGSFPSDFTHQNVTIYNNIDVVIFQCLDVSIGTRLLLNGSSLVTSISAITCTALRVTTHCHCHWLYSTCPGAKGLSFWAVDEDRHRDKWY